MVKCLTHDLRGFNGAIQRRLATLTATILISSCWQLSSEVELRCIFDVCKWWANSGSHEFVKKNMVRYMRPHGRFAHCSCKNAANVKMHFYTCSAPTARFGLFYRNIIFYDRDFCITYLVGSAKNLCFMQCRFINHSEILRWGCFLILCKYFLFEFEFKKTGARAVGYASAIALLRYTFEPRSLHVKFQQKFRLYLASFIWKLYITTIVIERIWKNESDSHV